MTRILSTVLILVLSLSFIALDNPVNLNNNSQDVYQIHKPRKRIGAVCRDGTTTSATGRGACSHHGGVRYWLYK